MNLLQYPVGTRVLYTHKKFSISYNGPHIIHVNLTYSDVLTSITSNKYVHVSSRHSLSLSRTDDHSLSLRRVEFTYEVEWTPSDIAYEDRFDRYLEDEYVLFSMSLDLSIVSTLDRPSLTASYHTHSGSLSTRSTGSRSSTRS